MKLQASLEGWSGSGLLASYDAERRPIGVRNTAEAADCFHRLFAVMQHGDELDEDSHTRTLRAELKADLKDQEKLIHHLARCSAIDTKVHTSPFLTVQKNLTTTRAAMHRLPGLDIEHHTSGCRGDALRPAWTRLYADSVRRKSGRRWSFHRLCRLRWYARSRPFAEQQAQELGVRSCMTEADLAIAWRKRAEDYDAASILDTARGAVR